MGLNNYLCGWIRELEGQWKTLQQSQTALMGENLDALRDMKHEELARLAWDALSCIERLGEYSYLISGLQAHLEGPGDHCELWCIAQADGDNNGGFNKWAKVVGGRVFGSDKVTGDVLLYTTWADAKRAFDEMYGDDPEIAKCMRIYPVVASAGNEPRTTKPPE